MTPAPKRARVDKKIESKTTDRKPCKYCKKEWSVGHTCKEFYEHKDMEKSKAKKEPREGQLHEGVINAIQVKDPSSPQAYSLISYTDDEDSDKDIVLNMIKNQKQNCKQFQESDALNHSS